MHDWFDHEQQQATAHVATYTFSVTARDLDDVSRLVQLLTTTAADALQIHGISFSHADSDALRMSARRAAVLDARTRAEQLAAAAAVQLGAVLAIEEGSDAGPGWFGRTLSASQGGFAAAPMPINPGGHDVSVRVVVTYAIG